VGFRLGKICSFRGCGCAQIETAAFADNRDAKSTAIHKLNNNAGEIATFLGSANSN